MIRDFDTVIFENMIPNTDLPEDVVNARVTVVVNDELSNCTSKEEVTGFFKYPLNLEGISVSMAREEK